MGSVSDITDSSGNLVEFYTYDVYGKVTVTDAEEEPLPESSIGNPYFFTGRRLDPETGLYYYRARYYSPELGRFLTTDPIGYEGGINLYTYCHNDPVNYTDPWGYCEEEAPEDPEEMLDEEIEEELEELEKKKKDKEGLTPEEEERIKELRGEKKRRKEGEGKLWEWIRNFLESVIKDVASPISPDIIDPDVYKALDTIIRTQPPKRKFIEDPANAPVPGHAG